MTIVFWTLVGFVVFAFVGFPITVLLLGALRRRRFVAADVSPSVSFVIAAYNEAHEGATSAIYDAFGMSGMLAVAQRLEPGALLRVPRRG